MATIEIPDYNAVFDMVRHESGWLEMETRNVKLNELIGRVVSTVSEYIAHEYDRVDKDRHQIIKPKFEYKIPSDLPEIEADSLRIERILIETLIAAVRIYDRTSESKIAFTVSCDNDQITMEIYDDGIGLPSHLTGETPYLYPTNKTIIEMHGGAMKVENWQDGTWVVNYSLPTQSTRFVIQ